MKSDRLEHKLGFPLTDPSFDFSILSENRKQLVNGDSETPLREKLLESCETLGFLKGKKQRTAVIHVFAAVRALSLVERVSETMRRVLDEAT